MKSALTALAIALVSFSAFASQNPDYQFTLVTQTGQTIDGHQLASLGQPALNNAGDVVFTGYEKAPIGSSTFLVGLFSPHRLVAPANGSLPACIGSYLLNDSGIIAFAQNTNLGPLQQFASGVYETSLSGGPVKTIAAAGSVVDGVQLTYNVCGGDSSLFAGFSFDDSGRIVFLGNPLFEYRPEKGLGPRTITEVDGLLVDDIIPVAGTSEEVLFSSSYPGGFGIFTPDRVVVKSGDSIDGLELTAILGPFVSSRRGLAFESLIGPLSLNQPIGIFTRHSLVVKTGQQIGDKVIAAPLLLDVNDQDEVVFSAFLNGGTQPNYLAIGNRNEIIVAVGDTINGRTIANLGTSPVLNNSGVVAFLATFSDGSQAIVKATRKWKR